MSFSPISYLQPLSLPLPPVDIRSNINNYLVERSFCDNWTEESLVHFPVRHPAVVLSQQEITTLSGTLKEDPFLSAQSLSPSSPLSTLKIPFAITTPLLKQEH